MKYTGNIKPNIMWTYIFSTIYNIIIINMFLVHTLDLACLTHDLWELIGVFFCHWLLAVARLLPGCCPAVARLLPGCCPAVARLLPRWRVTKVVYTICLAKQYDQWDCFCNGKRHTKAVNLEVGRAYLWASQSTHVGFWKEPKPSRFTSFKI